MSYIVKCFECGRKVTDGLLDSCPTCGGLLTVEMDLSPLAGKKLKNLRKAPMGVWRYAPFLPVDQRKAVSLLEGGTPLYHCKGLGQKLGMKDLMVSTRAPTLPARSRTRGMTVGVSRAVELGCKVVGCASTGNTSASLAAYAAKAVPGLRRLAAIRQSGAGQAGRSNVLRRQGHLHRWQALR